MKTIWPVIMILACLITGCMHAPVKEAAGPRQTPAREDFRDIIAKAKNKVFPMVVYIKVLRESHEAGKKISQEISGSGVIISPEGEVLTNWHVVDKAIDIRCLLLDGTAYDAEVVGSDKDTDLALIKLQLPSETTLPFAELGDSTLLSEGDFVMAMGAPWGLSRSVSMGIISCVERYLPEQSQYSLWLQTDASISPGNSGGPLVNTHGEVIGVNTLGNAMIEGGDIGFAVPSETIKVIIAQLKEHGKMNWSWTGLKLQPLHDFEKDINFAFDSGVIVSETEPESPARKAGVLTHDRVVKVNGQPLTAMTMEDIPAINRMLGLLPKNEDFSLELIRNEETLAISFSPSEKGSVEGEATDCPRWDMTVKAINRFDNPDLYFHRKEGVFIYGIKYPGNAANSSLRQKDIIIKVENETITTLEDLKKVHKKTLANISNKPKLVLSVIRNGLLRQVVLDISRDYDK